MTTAYKDISVSQYTYELPNERIAKYPLEKRDASKLLIYKHGNIQHDTFRNIPDSLPPDALMVFNNTRVVQARIIFRKPSGAFIEVFCLEPAGIITDVQLAFMERNNTSWFCLLGNAKKWKGGFLELKINEEVSLFAEKGEAINDGYLVHFSWEGDLSFAEVLEMIGRTPLPPYIDRLAEEADKTRYQTVYAQHSGSVAAPTAGLHFTPSVLDAIRNKGIQTLELTLHVGAGTFKPVSAPSIGMHHMHHEQIVISRDTLSGLLASQERKIVSVGTTSLRTLESIYWLGVKVRKGYTFDEFGFNLGQWESYEELAGEEVSAHESLSALLNYMDRTGLDILKGETSMIIVPGYKMRMADILVTNFHQPGSTLLLLVAAFCGDSWKDIYQYALENDFRFLSYGDSCLFFRDGML